MISRSASGRWAVSRPVYATEQRATIRRIPESVRSSPDTVGPRSGCGGSAGDRRQRLLRELQMPPQRRQILARQRTDARVQALARLRLGFLDVLLVILDLELGVGGVETRSGHRADDFQLPFLGGRRRLRHRDPELPRELNRFLQ